VDAVQENGTVFVYSGSYVESVTLAKPLHLKGESRETTLLDNGFGLHTISIACDHVTVSGMDLCNSKSLFDAALVVNNAHAVVVQDSRFSFNGKGVSVSSSQDVFIQANTFQKLTLWNGLTIGDSSHVQVIGNTFDGGYVRGWDTGYLSIIDNDFDAKNSIEGIEITYCDQAEVTGNTITFAAPMSNNSGLFVNVCKGGLFSHNTFAFCDLGISSSMDALVQENQISSGGFSVSDSPNLSMVGNSVNGKPIVYRENSQGETIEEAGQIILVGCSDMVVRNATITSTNLGVCLEDCGNTLVESCTFVDCRFGIYLNDDNGVSLIDNLILGQAATYVTGISGDSWYASIAGNQIRGHTRSAIDLVGFHCTIEGNTISLPREGESVGISLLGDHNVVARNHVSDNEKQGIAVGHYIGMGEEGTVKENDLINNGVGISISKDTANYIVCLNNMIDNDINGEDSGDNHWHLHYQGNYWSDYDGVDLDGDGIGDTPHPVPGGDNPDEYPLMNPWDWSQPKPGEVFVDDDYDSSTPGWGYTHFKRIAIALDRVADAGTILVHPGRYDDDLTIYKPVCLVAESSEKPAIAYAGTLKLYSDNITLQGFRIGPCSLDVISDHCVIQDNEMIGQGLVAISLSNTTDNRIEGNWIQGDDLAQIKLKRSDRCMIRDNVLDTAAGIAVEGELVEHWDSHTIEGNLLNGRPLLYYSNQHDMTIAQAANQVILASCDDMTIQGHSMTDIFGAVQLGFCTGCHVVSNDFTHEAATSGYKTGFADIRISYSTGCEAIGNTIYYAAVRDRDANYAVHGICYFESNDCTASNNTIEGGYYGIYYDECDKGSIENNKVTFSAKGIVVEDSSAIQINVNETRHCIGDGLNVAAILNSVIFGNIIADNGRGIFISYYFKDCNLIVDQNTIINNVEYGLKSECRMIVVSRNELRGNGGHNVILHNARYNQLLGNIIADSSGGSGVYMDCGTEATLRQNIIENNAQNGMEYYATWGCKVFYNVVRSNEIGCYFHLNACENEVYLNSIKDNGCGVKIIQQMSPSQDNLFYKNNLIDNLRNAWDDCLNVWNHAAEGGNYWDDYTGEDLNGDGFGDTPYVIPGAGSNCDQYPLMDPMPIE